MVFRKSRSFSRGRRPFRRRSSLNWQKADRPRKWQRANFFTAFDVVVPNISDTCVNTAVLLARTMNFGDLGQGQGFAIADMIRRVDIGGIVLDAFCWEFGALDGTFVQNTFMNFKNQMLCVDRLTVTGGPTAAAVMQLQRNQPPTQQVSATLPSTAQEDVDYPTRVLWRRMEKGVVGTQTYNPTSESSLYFANNVPTEPSGTHLNKRLRLPLDDEHGLFYVFSFLQPVDYAGTAARSYRCALGGSIYYQLAFGK